MLWSGADIGKPRGGGSFGGKISHYLCLVVCTSLFLQFQYSIRTLLKVRTGVWGKISHYLCLFVCTSLFLQIQHSIRTLLKVQTGSGGLPQKKSKTGFIFTQKYTIWQLKNVTRWWVKLRVKLCSDSLSGVCNITPASYCLPVLPWQVLSVCPVVTISWSGSHT